MEQDCKCHHVNALCTPCDGKPFMLIDTRSFSHGNFWRIQVISGAEGHGIGRGLLTPEDLIHQSAQSSPRRSRVCSEVQRRSRAKRLQACHVLGGTGRFCRFLLVDSPILPRVTHPPTCSEPFDSPCDRLIAPLLLAVSSTTRLCFCHKTLASPMRVPIRMWTVIR